METFCVALVVLCLSIFLARSAPLCMSSGLYSMMFVGMCLGVTGCTLFLHTVIGVPEADLCGEFNVVPKIIVKSLRPEVAPVDCE